jgi:hypothetical protein
MHTPSVSLTATGPVKRRPWKALSQEEVTQLMEAFTRGKTEILGEDALTLVKWAEAMRHGALCVEMILARAVIPLVQDGRVTVALPGEEERP